VFYFLRVSICLILLTSLATADETRKISADALKNDQLAVSGRYDRFERLLSQMADVLGHDDPERAELLRRAISKGREKAISNKLGQIADDLDHSNLGKALEQQEEVLVSLATLLQLLQSEDRRSELEKERERLNNLLKGVTDTLNQQKSARASTQNSTAPSSSAPNQQKAIDRADKILDDIKAHDGNAEDASKNGENSAKKNDENPDSSTDGETETPADKQSNSKSDGNDTDPSEGKTEDTDSQKSESSESSSNKSDSPPSDQPKPSNAESKDSQSQNGKDNADSKQTPGSDEVSKARQFMQEALEQLQEQLRDKALDKQDGAIAELQKAVEELRNQLLQLREEEKEMILASLEARFQRMLSAQTQIYDETVDLDATPVTGWLDTMFARSREVAQQQAELQVECQQTLGLLLEDGTSVAIVLSVEDISADMATIAGRLRESKVGALTQTLETDIIDALKELIAATQREMQEMKSEERQQQQAQSGEQKKPPLVQLMAEIKILRSLQLRINQRTQRIDGFLAEQSDDDQAALIQQLEQLTTRQQRLVESAEELGKRIAR
jgi:hypothetical protein